MRDPDAKLFSAIDWMSSQAFKIDKVFGNLADLMWKDKKCCANKA